MVSSNAYIWFGIPGASMQWVPAPQAGFQRNWIGNNQTIALDDGRQFINSTAQKHSQFVGSYFGRYDNPDGINIDVFADFASGFYGSGPICFANPYALQRNLFAPQWASPGMLIPQGWSSPVYGTPAFSGVAPTNGRPKTAALYSIPTSQSPNAAYTSASKYNHYIAIPPNMTLYIGYTGGTWGTGGVFVQPYNASDNSLATAVTLSPMGYTATSHTNATFAGSSYNAVRVFFGKTDTTANSGVTVDSMMARLYPTGSTPPATYNHVPGQGNLGLAIVGDSIAETYNYNGISKSLNLTLEEVI